MNADQLRLEHPCDEPWDAMKAEGRDRRCERCALVVHDLSNRTEGESKALLGAAQGRICIRYAVRKATGQVMFATAVMSTATAAMANGAVPQLTIPEVTETPDDGQDPDADAVNGSAPEGGDPLGTGSTIEATTLEDLDADDFTHYGGVYVMPRQPVAPPVTATPTPVTTP